MSWLTVSMGSVEGLKPIAATPPNLREEICGKYRGRARTDHADEEEVQAAPTVPAGQEPDSGSSAYAATMPTFRPLEKTSLLGPITQPMEPVVVSVIPPPNAPADPDALMAKPTTKRPIVGAGKTKGRKSAVINIVAKPAADKAKTAAVTSAKDTAKQGAKDKKPEAKPATKPAAAKPAAAKPVAAKPKPIAKPNANGGAKPAPKSAAAPVSR
jgi:D-alanyl-D-alanine carboxypeptidase